MSGSVFINQVNKIEEVSIYELKSLQGKLKTFSDSSYQKIKARLLEVGIKYLFYFWEAADGEKYIIDGHHRQKTLLKMKNEGYLIPEYYPAIRIEAKDKQEAAKELLYFNSNFGEMTAAGQKSFIEAYQITAIEIKDIQIKDFNITFDKIDIDNDVDKYYDDFSNNREIDDAEKIHIKLNNKTYEYSNEQYKTMKSIIDQINSLEVNEAKEIIYEAFYDRCI